jgi:hypothetical protein
MELVQILKNKKLEKKFQNLHNFFLHIFLEENEFKIKLVQIFYPI